MRTDDQQLHDLFEHLKQTWTDNDAAAYAALFTEGSDYVSYDGTRTTASAPPAAPSTQANHDRLFRGVLAGSALVGDLETIRYLTPEVAILHGTASVLMPWRAKLPRRRLSRQTIVAVRTPEGWRVSAIHNGRVRPVTVPAPDAFPSRMSQLMTTAAARVGLGRTRERHAT
jgi:uncharacterized protein (TIGR02246 family)